MRLIGYCMFCHKIKYVNVTRFLTSVDVQTGICSGCETAKAAARPTV